MTTNVIGEKAKTLIDGIKALDWNSQITSDAEQKDAANMLASVKANAKELKAKKEAITKPLNAALKEVRSQFKPAEERIEAIETAIKDAMLEYHDRKELETQKEIDRIENDGRTKLTTKMAKLADVDQPQTDLGGAQIKYGPQKLRITDVHKLIDAVPDLLDYETVLEAIRVRAASRYMPGDLLPPGVEFHREKLVAGIAG